MAGYKYNYGSDDPAEYSDTPYADQVNGTNGANTIGAKTNQMSQRPAAKTDPYAAFAQWGKEQAAKASGLAGVIRPRANAFDDGGALYGHQRPPHQPNVTPVQPTTKPPQTPTLGVQPTTQPTPEQPSGAPAPQPAPSPQNPKPSTQFQPQNAAPTGGDKNATMTNADAPIGDYGAPPNGVSQDAWNLANTWAQKYPAYAWAAKNPNIVERYLQDALMWAQNGATGIQFADWLHSNAPNYQNPDYTKAAGYDTYLYASAEDAAAGKMRQRTNTPPPPQGGQQPPYVPPSQGNDRGPQPVMDDKGNILGYTYHSFSTGVTSPYTDARPLFDVTGKNVLGWMRENGQFIPNTTAPTNQPGTQPPGGGGTPPPDGGPIQQQPPDNQSDSPPPSEPGGTPGPEGGPNTSIDVPTLESDPFGSIGKYYDPLFKQQQEDLARVLRAQGALTGDINAGGFTESLGRQEANLINQQGVQKADAIQKAQEMGLQKYQIDADLFGKQMADATTRFGIQTNADLQKWLDENDNELKKYGIDKNDILARYQAELQLEGQKYSADAGVRAASLQAAAAKAAASANAAASKYAANLAANTAANRLNFDWGQLQADLYSGDQNRMVQWANILQNAGITPAELMQILNTFGPSPPIFSQPTGGH